MAEKTIEVMAQLVRTRPTITLREIAAELGFAEEGSVYYWLRKAGHKGLRDFKQAVLQDARLQPLGDASTANVSAASVREERGAVWEMIVESGEYAPWVFPGDALLVEQGAPPQDGALVIADLPQKPRGIWRFYRGEPSFLVHPAKPNDVVVIPSTGNPPKGVIVGTVTRLVRRRP